MDDGIKNRNVAREKTSRATAKLFVRLLLWTIQIKKKIIVTTMASKIDDLDLLISKPIQANTTAAQQSTVTGVDFFSSR